MKCTHCKGIVLEEKWYDLPKNFIELYCLNCGKRFWINMKELMSEISLN